LVFFPAISWAATCTPGLTAVDGGGNAIANGQNVAAGVKITLSACFSTSISGITSVIFSYSADNTTWTNIGTASVTTGSPNGPFTIPAWSPTTTGNLYLQASATYPGSSSAPTAQITTNGQIDMVGDPNLPSLQYKNNPALDPAFGEGAPNTMSNTWTPGDNQFCAVDTYRCTGNGAICTQGGTCSDGSLCTNWKYNGSSVAFPDGQCEWSNSVSQVSSSTTAPPVDLSKSTVDGLDETMHTLSDFLAYANSLINQDVGTLSSSVDSWYPQLATWVAPACGGDGSSTGFDPNKCDQTGHCAACTLATDPNCDVSATNSNGCNQGTQNGRLLSIYNPGSVDVLKDWNSVITPWLNNNYANSGAWCVPPSTTGSSDEDNYINANSQQSMYNYATNFGIPQKSTTWGDLPHVINCLNYNAGQNSDWSQTSVANYQTCLGALSLMNAAGTCPTTAGVSNLPDVCQLAVLGNPPNLAMSATPPPTSGCDPSQSGSFAKWVSDSINFGPAYNFQQCLTAMTSGTCPGPDSEPAACSKLSSIRNLLSQASEAMPEYGCSTGSGTFMQWVTDSLNLAKDEAPKFALRATYLKEVFTKAQTLQNMSYQGEMALASLLGSGGPVTSLETSRSAPSIAQTFPNAVIYGWVDKTLPNGKTLPASQGGAGYAHIVKITAFAPGRNGSSATTGTNDNAWFIQSKLPWIQTSSDWDSRTFELVQRDGYVYVSVKRWDQDHSTALGFPNNHKLWQFSFSSPNSVAGAGSGFPGACNGSMSPNQVAFGLMPATAAALKSYPQGFLSGDATAIQNAFMLNDEGDGAVDPGANNSDYKNCLSAANTLLENGVESHACVQYIASRPGQNPDGTATCGGGNSVQSGVSGDNDCDYSLKFVDCNSILQGKPAPDDLTFTQQ
jgi:hypothetical protein